MLHRSMPPGLGLLLPLAVRIAATAEASDTVTLTLPKRDPQAGRAADQGESGGK